MSIRATQDLRTSEQVDALARYLQSLRPGQRPWTIDAIRNAIIEAGQHSRDAKTLTLAAITATLDPTNVTPAVIGMTGPHWTEAFRMTTQEPGETHQPPRVRTYCPNCSWVHYPDETCTTYAPTPSHMVQTYADQLRSEIQHPQREAMAPTVDAQPRPDGDSPN